MEDKQYFHFSETEKKGILVLLLLLLCAVFIFVYLNLQEDKLAADLPSQEKYIQAWKAMQESSLQNSTAAEAAIRIPPRLFLFDPNTVDSLQLKELGLPAKTIRTFLNYRNKGAKFYKKEDFRKVWTLSEADYLRLEPYIVITAPMASADTAAKKQWEEPRSVLINTCSKEELMRLRGIGNFYADRIIDYRNALGGFVHIDQLREAYRFPDSTFALLQRKLVVQASAIKKIDVNKASEAELKQHPYIGDKMAPGFIKYRNDIQKFKNIEEIRQLPLMNEEIYRKIVPYLSLE